MSRSHSLSAPATILAEADATNLTRVRCQFAKEKAHIKVTYSHMLTSLLAKALAQHPKLNAAYVDDSLIEFDEINIGVATSIIDGNLIVPVVKNVLNMSLEEIATKTNELIAKARSGKIRREDLQGGTFTLSNVGMLPSIRWTTPILNLPQVAILGVGAIQEKVIIRDGEISTKIVLGLSLTFDHRAINGFAAANFIQTLSNIISEPFPSFS